MAYRIGRGWTRGVGYAGYSDAEAGIDAAAAAAVAAIGHQYRRLRGLL